MPKIKPNKKTEYNKTYYWKNKQRLLHSVWVMSLKNLYGITEVDYNKLLDKQDRACGICATPASELTQRLHVDHNHQTGKVRGLLCHKCNRGLGLFNDDLKVLRTAHEYLDNAA